MVEVGRGLWSSSAADTLLMQGCLQLVAQDRVLMAFEQHGGWRFHNLSGQPVPVVTLTVKKA